MSDMRDVHGVWCGDLRDSGHLEYIGIKGRIILKWVFKEWNWEAWTGLILFSVVTVGGRL
jgi:hypothetical protein